MPLPMMSKYGRPLLLVLALAAESACAEPAEIARSSGRGAVGGQFAGYDLSRALIPQSRRGPRLDVYHAW